MIISVDVPLRDHGALDFAAWRAEHDAELDVEAAPETAPRTSLASPAPQGLGPYLTIGEAAALLRVSSQTVRRRIRLGRLRAVKPGTGGTRVLIERSSVEKMLA